MPYADDFRTLAEIAIAGFTGIVVALEGRSSSDRAAIGALGSAPCC